MRGMNDPSMAKLDANVVFGSKSVFCEQIGNWPVRF